jgi:hypothetical protein
MTLTKTLYVIDYWVPFPRSEYGGVMVVVAANDEECFTLLERAGGYTEDEELHDVNLRYAAKEAIRSADKFPLADRNAKSKIIKEFTT